MSRQSRENLRQGYEELLSNLNSVDYGDVSVYDEQNRSNDQFVDDGSLHCVRNGFRFSYYFGQEFSERRLQSELRNFCLFIDESWDGLNNQ